MPRIYSNGDRLVLLEFHMKDGSVFAKHQRVPANWKFENWSAQRAWAFKVLGVKRIDCSEVEK